MKGVKIEMDMYKEIRQRHLAGDSQRKIAREMNISRQVVQKYHLGDTIPEERKQYTRSSPIITDEITKFILECFEEDKKENLKKQKHTAKRIYDRLVNDYNFTGGESTVRNAIKEIKGLQKVPPQAIMPLSYEPGEAIQIDWGEATVYLSALKIKVYIFCGRLCNCCDIFVQTYKAANQESFLEAQKNMFDYFKGIPNRVIFDNAKVAVKEGFGIYAKPQDKYASFSAHYSFELDFCNPAKGNEKSLVENLVGYARRNFFVPLPRVSSISELNEKLLEECLKYRNNHKVKSRTHPVKTLYQEELGCLNPIPKFNFDTSKSIPLTVDDFSTIKFDKNHYSVPVSYIRKTVTAKGYGNELIIMYQNTEIARHERFYGKHDTIYTLDHYISLLERKPRSVSNARPVKETMKKELLEWGKLLPGGNREMVKLLRLCVDYGEEKILEIKSQIPTQIIPTVDMIRSYLNDSVEPAIIYISPNEIPVEPIDLKLYDKQFGVVRV
jgi:transposase